MRRALPKRFECLVIPYELCEFGVFLEPGVFLVLGTAREVVDQMRDAEEPVRFGRQAAVRVTDDALLEPRLDFHVHDFS
eukprot:2275396-Pleurochrysis_carterae.AAC.1